ncbi:MAG: sigma factor-like helix-turn-helix DNA-binding protein [Bacillota bacterium]|nr:sigma factor-like helix-turn-helix DNA-binding protein [Bacillota bacterium]
MRMEELKESLEGYIYYEQAIENIDLNIKEIEYEILGTPGISGQEQTSKSNSFHSVTEDQAITLITKKTALQTLLKKKEIMISKIDNALESLTDEEKNVIKLFYIEHRTWQDISCRLNYSERTCRYRRESALKKMLGIINNKR